MTEMELQKALAEVREGNREAFVGIYRDLSKPVYTVILRIVRHRELAEDVTQDLFVKLFVAPPDASVVDLPDGAQSGDRCDADTTYRAIGRSPRKSSGV